MNTSQQSRSKHHAGVFSHVHPFIGVAISGYGFSTLWQQEQQNEEKICKLKAINVQLAQENTRCVEPLRQAWPPGLSK